MTNEINQEARVWRFSDQGVAVAAKSGIGDDYPIDPVQIRAGSRPSSIVIKDLPGVGAEMLVDDLLEALRQFRCTAPDAPSAAGA